MSAAVRSRTRSSSAARLVRSASSESRRKAASALSARLGSVVLIMKVSSSRKTSLRSIAWNGPAALNAPQIANPVSTSATVAVSRGPRRSAAHSSGTMVRKASGVVCCVRGTSGLKAISPTSTAIPSTAALARHSPAAKPRQSKRAHNTSTGASTRMPAASPSHQVIQTGKY